MENYNSGQFIEGSVCESDTVALEEKHIKLNFDKSQAMSKKWSRLEAKVKTVVFPYTSW